MKNEFNEETRQLFSETYKCFYCGSNKADSLHHIVGRGSSGDEESSVLNAAPLCNYKCHISNHNFLRTEKQMRNLLSMAYDFVINSKYSLNEKDGRFIDKYVHLYS